MPYTYTYGDIIIDVQKCISRTLDEDMAATILNKSMAEVWKKYDWRESLEDLPSFWLAPGTQDYGSPLVVVPSDFAGLRRGYVVNINSTPAQIYELTILKWLGETSVRGFPQDIGYIAEKNAFRLNPLPPDSMCVPNFIVRGTYKKTPPKITASNYIDSALPFSDQYFNNLCEYVKYEAYKQTRDFNNAEKQQGFALEAIQSMANDVGLNDNDTFISPSGPLAWGETLWPGGGFRRNY
jgi:hypothetical protein